MLSYDNPARGFQSSNNYDVALSYHYNIAYYHTTSDGQLFYSKIAVATVVLPFHHFVAVLLLPHLYNQNRNCANNCFVVPYTTSFHYHHNPVVPMQCSTILIDMRILIAILRQPCSWVYNSLAIIMM